MSQPKIVVTTTIPRSALEILRKVGNVHAPEEGADMTAEELRAEVADASAVVCTVADSIDAGLAAAAGPRLSVVSTISVGYDNIDVDALRSRQVTVTNTPGVLTDATADLTWGLLLMVTRRLGEGERLLRSGTPWSFHLNFMLGTGLRGKTLGIVGLGKIGTAVARRARAFGMEIRYSANRRVDSELEDELGAWRLELPELLESSDVVSLHCPLTSRTRHLIGPPELQRMRRDAVLLNTTRGAVVDEDALATAVADGTIAGAGLDVFENEPRVHPRLLELDNVALTPHLGSATVETRGAMADLAARNVAAVLTDEQPPSPV